MEKILLQTNIFFEHLPDTVRRYRLFIWLSFFVIIAVILAGLPKVNIDLTMEAYFKKNDPAKLAYDKFRAEFGSDEVLFLTFQARDGDIFSDQSLKALQSLHTELSEYHLSAQEDSQSGLDHITDVTSLINVSYMEASEGVLLSRPFIGDQLPKNDKVREELRKKALNHPDFKGVYLSEDSRFGALVIETDLAAQLDQTDSESKTDDLSAEQEWDEETVVDVEAAWDENMFTGDEEIPKFRQADVTEYSAFINAIKEVTGKAEYADHLEFHPTGVSATTAFLNDEILPQMGIVITGLIVLIMILLWVLFHSFSAVVWSMCIVIFSFMSTLGLVGWSGAVMTIMINIIVFLIIAVGIANAIHILSGYLYFREAGEDHRAALRSVLKKSGLACFLTSLTTAIGLFSLALTPIVPIKNFGIFAAIGVLVAFLLTVVMLPLMLDMWAPVSKKKKIEENSKPHKLQRLLRQVEHVGYTYPKSVVATFSVLSIVLLFGIPLIKVDSNIIEILPHESSVRKDVAVVDDSMAGTVVMDILFDAGKSDAFKDPRLLNRMESLQQFMESEYGELVGDTGSLVNVSKDAFKALNEDKQEFYRIPQDPRVLSQTLFMFNNANPEDRRKLVSDDYSNARMTITLKSAGSYIYVPMIDDINNKIDSLFKDVKSDYPELTIQVTGGMSLMTRVVDYISWSQIESFGVALAVISVLLLLVFGSARIGLIAVIPNLMPIICAFGLMGYLNMPLNTDTLLVAPILIGIAVDDTIHYLSHFRVCVLQTENIKEAIQQTIREVGQAITFTSVVLAVGFFVFIFSSQLSMANFGILSAISILMALVTDLLLLPALCVLFKADFKRIASAEKNSQVTTAQ
ncbi:efflux RND transporter permease subunit [Teredinibacter haidensis]|uniref:efflux RND transporter permease subunit n=1 Tax=Teredinibacter haidensis TaxID=2731755 RepID=UPI000948BD01|nr:MMPL family transporter [Teredinibacter haidensis]